MHLGVRLTMVGTLRCRQLSTRGRTLLTCRITKFPATPVVALGRRPSVNFLLTSSNYMATFSIMVSFYARYRPSECRALTRLRLTNLWPRLMPALGPRLGRKLSTLLFCGSTLVLWKYRCIFQDPVVRSPGRLLRFRGSGFPLPVADWGVRGLDSCGRD